MDTCRCFSNCERHKPGVFLRERRNKIRSTTQSQNRRHRTQVGARAVLPLLHAHLSNSTHATSFALLSCGGCVAAQCAVRGCCTQHLYQLPPRGLTLWPGDSSAAVDEAAKNGQLITAKKRGVNRKSLDKSSTSLMLSGAANNHYDTPVSPVGTPPRSRPPMGRRRGRLISTVFSTRQRLLL